MNGTPPRALILRPQTTLDVDTDESKARALQILEQAKAGSPMFPRDLTPAQAATLARITLRYGLDPLLNELTLYQGAPYLTIDGRLRIANGDPQFDGMEVRPATEAEREAFRCSADEHLWVCSVWRKDRRLPAVGYGRAGGRSDRNPVSRDFPQEMASKRARHRALRDAFSIPIPGLEEVETGLPPLPPSAPVIDQEPPGLTRKQTIAVHVLAKNAGLSDDEYRAMLRDTFGVASSQELTEGQAAAFVELLQARITRPTLFENRRVLEALADDEYYEVEPEPEPLPEPEPEPQPVPTDLLGERVIDDPNDAKWKSWLRLVERVTGDPACQDLELAELELPVRLVDLQDAFEQLRSLAKLAQGARRSAP